MIGVENAAAGAAMALQALQHRGQDACGIGTVHNGRVHVLKDLGMVSQVFSMGALATLPGTAAIGHVRYPTVGAGVRDDTQPFHTRRPGVLMAHNGNVTNVPQLEAWLQRRGIRVQSRCDVEPIMLVFAEGLRGSGVEHVKDAVRDVFDQVRGAYTCAGLVEIEGRDTLVAFRDPYGVRPGVYGKNGLGAWCVASESVALDALGFEMVGEIAPGAVVILRPNEAARVEQLRTAEPRRCMFERIYFARPDSMMEDGRVFQVRWDLGVRLGEEWRKRGLAADVVVPVPDTSRPAAQAMAETLGLPFREGFIKNRYSGRTFITARVPEAEWARTFGVDSVTFLSVEGLRESARTPACMACFDGIYPIPVSREEAAAIVADRRGSGP